jgi:hypothetical protein
MRLSVLINALVSSYSFFILGEQEVTLRAAGPGLMPLFPRMAIFGDFLEFVKNLVCGDWISKGKLGLSGFKQTIKTSPSAG